MPYAISRRYQEDALGVTRVHVICVVHVYAWCIGCDTCACTMRGASSWCRLLRISIHFAYILCYIYSHVHTRVPGLPIRNCAGISNNLVPRGTKVSAIDATVKIIFERLYLVPGLGTSFVFGSRTGYIWALSQLSLCTHNFDRSLTNYFPISVLFPERPLIFFVSTIHQVIWPSPGTLVHTHLCVIHTPTRLYILTCIHTCIYTLLLSHTQTNGQES